jgi:acyl-CoA thioester hydrolase
MSLGRPIQVECSMLREHEIQIRVRYQECDPMGFLHHAYYFTYFEMGRTELLRAMGGNYRQMEQSGLFVVVVKAECRYQRPARYDDVLTLHTRVARVTPAKIEHEYRLLRDGELLAVGHVTMAVVDRSGKVQPVPDEMLVEP